MIVFPVIFLLVVFSISPVVAKKDKVVEVEAIKATEAVKASRAKKDKDRAKTKKKQKLHSDLITYEQSSVEVKAELGKSIKKQIIFENASFEDDETVKNKVKKVHNLGRLTESRRILIKEHKKKNPEITDEALEEVSSEELLATITSKLLELELSTDELGAAEQFEAMMDASEALLAQAKAGEYENIEFIQSFLAAGAFLDYQDLLRRTSLSWAALYGSMDVLETFLSAGADPNTQDLYGDTPLMHAATTGFNDAVVLLIPLVDDIDLKDESGMTAFSLACKFGKTDCAQLLFDAQASIDMIDIKSMVPLHWAAFKGHADTVNFLLSMGAKTELVDLRNERTPLIWAARYGHTNIVNQLIAAGANLHVVDKAGWTAYKWAIRKSHTSAASLLEAAIQAEIT